jgi:dihydropyrimidinase
VPRPAFNSAAVALSKWKELTAPKQINRDPLNIPAGI